MLGFFSLAIVRAFVIQDRYGCKDDKEHTNRVVHQFAMCALKLLVQLNIPLGQTQDRYVPIVPCFGFCCSNWPTNIQDWKKALSFLICYFCIERYFAKLSIVLLIEPRVAPNEHQDVEMTQKGVIVTISEYSCMRITNAVDAPTKP